MYVTYITTVFVKQITFALKSEVDCPLAPINENCFQ